MISSFAIPLLAAALFGLAAPAAGRRLRPDLAVWALVLGGCAVTGACLLAAAEVAVAGLGRVTTLATFAHWSPAAMAVGNPYSPAVGAVVAVVLAGLLGRGARTVLVGGRRLRGAWAAAAAAGSDLVVTDDPEPVAYAVPGRPGWPGRIVVSRSLLRSLDNRGRRALLAHERAHLDGRDDLHLYAAAVCAGLNPLLGQLPAAVSAACERRADHAAARCLGDRRAVAEAIAAAVLPPSPAVALCAAGGEINDRVEALLSPARRGLLPLGGVAVLVATTIASVLWLGHDLDAVTDAAATLFRHSHPSGER